MATLKWKNGKNGIQQLTLELEKRAEKFRKQSLRALELSVQEGAVYLQDALEAAHTKTGQERVESGRGQFAGRHDTGNMVGSISWSDAVERPARNIYVMKFGWFKQYFEQYFRDQDLGEGNIPAARAMWQAYARARNNFAARMDRIVRGQSIG